MRRIFILMTLFILVSGAACKNKNLQVPETVNATGAVYTCPMHPEIIRDKPGKCPICGMDLVLKYAGGNVSKDLSLESLLRPTNEFVVSSVPVVSIQSKEEQVEIDALGYIAYDTKQVGSVSARISGRIEKLYVRYRFQKVTKGQHLMDVYSPELVSAQQNLLFLLRNDPDNAAMITASKEKLLLLGMGNDQLQQVIKANQPSQTIAIFSDYNGHIHDAVSSGMNPDKGAMRDVSLLTEELSLKEGMYVQKGQTVFVVYNPDYAWALLNIYGEYQGLVEKGDPVRISPESAPGKDFRGKIDFIEPFFRKESKTLSARVLFKNDVPGIQIGSQVRATVFSRARFADWLPDESVISLGLDKVVFRKVPDGFTAHKVTTGIHYKNRVQILNGLTHTDSVALNAHFLMDSESFIKVKE